MLSLGPVDVDGTLPPGSEWIQHCLRQSGDSPPVPVREHSCCGLAGAQNAVIGHMSSQWVESSLERTHFKKNRSILDWFVSFKFCLHFLFIYDLNLKKLENKSLYVFHLEHVIRSALSLDSFLVGCHIVSQCETLFCCCCCFLVRSPGERLYWCRGN